jgi:hypothetical protein
MSASRSKSVTRVTLFQKTSQTWNHSNGAYEVAAARLKWVLDRKFKEPSQQHDLIWLPDEAGPQIVPGAQAGELGFAEIERVVQRVFEDVTTLVSGLRSYSENGSTRHSLEPSPRETVSLFPADEDTTMLMLKELHGRWTRQSYFSGRMANIMLLAGLLRIMRKYKTFDKVYGLNLYCMQT